MSEDFSNQHPPARSGRDGATPSFGPPPLLGPHPRFSERPNPENHRPWSVDFSAQRRTNRQGTAHPSGRRTAMPILPSSTLNQRSERGAVTPILPRIFNNPPYENEIPEHARFYPIEPEWR